MANRLSKSYEYAFVDLLVVFSSSRDEIKLVYNDRSPSSHSAFGRCRIFWPVPDPRRRIVCEVLVLTYSHSVIYYREMHSTLILLRALPFVLSIFHHMHTRTMRVRIHSVVLRVCHGRERGTLQASWEGLNGSWRAIYHGLDLGEVGHLVPKQLAPTTCRQLASSFALLQKCIPYYSPLSWHWRPAHIPRQ